MNIGVARRTFTVRLPGPLYDASATLASEQGISLNELVRQALERVARQAEEGRLYEAFGLLGEDAEEADVDFALPAQSEVVLEGARKQRRRRGPAAR